MLHKEIIQHKIIEARMGAKDLASVKIPQDATFGFEFEIAANKEDWGEVDMEAMRADAYRIARDEIRVSDVFGSLGLKGKIKALKEQGAEPRYGWLTHEEAATTVSENREKVREILKLPETTLEEKQEKLATILFYKLLNVDLFQQSYEKLLGDAKEYTERDMDRLDSRLEKESKSISIEYFLNENVATNVFWLNKDRTDQKSLEDLKYTSIARYFENWNNALFDEKYVEPRIEERATELFSDLGPTISEEDASKTIIDHFAEGLSGVASYEYHGEEKSYDRFVIEPDASIEPFGCEIVSPIYRSWDKAKSGLHHVLVMIQEENVFTNKSTGLHCNIGGAFLKDIDWIKFFLFFGEFEALAKWGRSNNSYARPYFYDLARHFEDNTEAMMKNGKVVPDFDTTRKLASDNLISSREKYKTINFSHLPKGYVEMRVAGGAGYENKEEEIVKLIQKFLRAAAIALDPNAYREEYYKNLYKLWRGDKLLDSYSDNPQLSKKIEKFLPLIGLQANRLGLPDYMTRAAIVKTIFDKQSAQRFKNPKIRSIFRELFFSIEPSDPNVTKNVISKIQDDVEVPKEIRSFFIQLLKKDT